MQNILGLNEFHILERREEDNSILFVVEPVQYVPSCPNCRSPVVNKHGKISRHARDLNYFDKLCELEIVGDRYKCDDCGKTFTPVYRAIDEGAKVTNRLKDKIKRETLKKPFMQLAQEHSLSVQSVKRFFHEYVEDLERQKVIKAPIVIGIDEAHLNKQMRAVFTDIKEKKILEVLPGRSKESVITFLNSIPDNGIIKVGTIDMYRPYKEALLEMGSNIVVVIDKFHVVRYAVDAMESVRKRLAQDVHKNERRFLVNTRYSLLKNKEKTTEGDLSKMEQLFSRYPEYYVAYQLKEAFRDIYENKTKAKALDAFKVWEASIPDNMEPFKEVAKTVGRWEAEIFNYFDYPYTNAFTESSNNLIKEIEKRGRGYTFEVLRAKVLFGTSATKMPRYKRPAASDRSGTRMSLLGTDKPVLESGFGVDISELLAIMANEDF